MDPLSVTASIITVLQAANQVVSICYDYAAAGKGSSWGLPRVIDELKNLRNVLESLEQLSQAAAGTDPAARSRLPNLTSLCDPNHGPLVSCRKELNRLSEKLSTPAWASHYGPRRKSLVQSLRWPLKEGDTKKTLEDIERFKTILGLALTADQA
jgi:Fungal N-terminal domain of STAND proteins